mmetsp:Transcript_6442/g.9890  ORF Transcript_6442/g.9890 Transcript_6442/m.9890 type:complete len:289 (+) Transcript_6442:480-1346(+)
MTHLYIDQEEHFKRLGVVLNNSKKVFVFGDIGSGKSALIANWINRLEKKMEKKKGIGPGRSTTLMRSKSHISRSHINMKVGGFTTPQGITWSGNVNIVERYLEASSYPRSSILLYLLNSEIQQIYGTDLKLDSALAAEQFIDLLNLVSKRAAVVGPLLLVMDGLDHMTGDNDNILAWLPDNYPPGVALLASCSNSKLVSENITYKSLVARKYDAYVRIKPLTTKRSLSLMKKYLADYGKKLDEIQQKIVLDSPHTRQPLFLMTVLNEVRVFRDFFGVTDRIRVELLST